MPRWFLPLGFLTLLSAGCGDPVCGNTELEDGEQCDDGNLVNGDGCKEDCSLPVCNDGVFDPGELCFAEQSFSTSDGATQGLGPISVVAADINNDSFPDLITGNSVSSDFTVLLNDGAGNFGNQSFQTLLNTPFSLFTDDFNGDQKPDLVVVNQADDTFTMVPGATGVLSTPQAPIIVIGGPRTGASVDLENNGTTGLIILNFDANVARLFSVDANLTVSPNAPEIFLDTNIGPVDAAASDLNNDSNQDIVIAHKNQNILKVFLSLGGGIFDNPQDIVTSGGATALLIEDVNEDGVLDLVITNEDQQTLDVFTKDANQNFTLTTQISCGGIPNAPIFTDFNADGIKDFVVSNEGISIGVILGNSDGTFQTIVEFDTTDAADFIATDVNQDGKLDIVTIDDLNNIVRILVSTD